MKTLDSMIAPRALTAREVAEVAAEQLSVYGIAHRAFTLAGLWTNDAMTQAAETALAAIIEDAEKSVKDWLGDCQTDGEPRFYQAAGLKRVVAELCQAAGRLTCAQSDHPGVAVIASMLEDRDAKMLEALIADAAS